MKAPEVPFRLQIAFPEILFYFVVAVAMVKSREKREASYAHQCQGAN